MLHRQVLIPRLLQYPHQQPGLWRQIIYD